MEQGDPHGTDGGFAPPPPPPAAHDDAPLDATDPRNTEPDFDEWRRGGITGTDAPKILGVSRWGDALDVYISKTGLAGQVRTPDTGQARAGRVLEEPAAREFVALTGRSVQRVPRRAHPERLWQRTHMDRRVVADQERGLPRAGLEIKTVGIKGWRDLDDRVCPEHFAAQLAHSCAVWGYRAGFVFVLCRDNWQSKVYAFDFWDGKIIADLCDLEHRFWHEHVVKRVPPLGWVNVAKPEAPKGEATDSAGLMLLGGDIGQMFARDMVELYEARALADEAAAVADMAQRQCEAFMQAHALEAAEVPAIVDGVAMRLRYRYKQTEGRRTLDQQALLKFLRAHHPDIEVDQFYKTGKPGTYSRAFFLRERG